MSNAESSSGLPSWLFDKREVIECVFHIEGLFKGNITDTEEGYEDSFINWLLQKQLPAPGRVRLGIVDGEYTGRALIFYPNHTDRDKVLQAFNKQPIFFNGIRLRGRPALERDFRELLCFTLPLLSAPAPRSQSSTNYGHTITLTELPVSATPNDVSNFFRNFVIATNGVKPQYTSQAEKDRDEPSAFFVTFPAPQDVGRALEKGKQKHTMRMTEVAIKFGAVIPRAETQERPLDLVETVRENMCKWEAGDNWGLRMTHQLLDKTSLISSRQQGRVAGEAGAKKRRLQEYGAQGDRGQRPGKGVGSTLALLKQVKETHDQHTGQTSSELFLPTAMGAIAPAPMPDPFPPPPMGLGMHHGVGAHPHLPPPHPPGMGGPHGSYPHGPRIQNTQSSGESFTIQQQNKAPPPMPNIGAFVAAFAAARKET